MLFVLDDKVKNLGYRSLGLHKVMPTSSSPSGLGVSWQVSIRSVTIEVCGKMPTVDCCVLCQV